MEFPRFSEKDCGQEMTRDEGRNIQVDMLDSLVAFCNENGLRYFLSGGTLLGAIRHHGFIPWDDDIDVNMPRPDCEKLMELTGGKLGNYRVLGPDLDGFSWGCEIYRVYNFDTVIEDYMRGTTKTHPIYYPIFIDIFPIEGLPRGKWKTYFHYLHIIMLRKMQRSSWLEHMMGKSALALVFHIISKIPAKLVGYRRWSLMIQKTATKYDFNMQDYIGVMTTAVHTLEEKMPKKDYMHEVDVLFEGKYYHAPGNYDEYLTKLYGDYMQIPSEEKQESGHTFQLYWNSKSKL